MLSAQVCHQARISRDPRFDGLFFVLVKSTKIFCRNTCKVRLPLEKNVSYSERAESALAQGYRPCLRCRPDSAPLSFAWQGVNTTVSRAINLLSENLACNIHDIAERLGISERYLHKLFTEHLNLSPKQFVLYQRLLMAKGLLQQTHLSIEQVAHSVGFSGARQLQVHSQKIMNLTPSQIRKTQTINRGANKLDKDISLSLSYRPPYQWSGVRDFYARRQINENEYVGNNTMRKILNIEGYPILVKLEHVGEENKFMLQFDAAYSRHVMCITRVVRRMLDLDADPNLIRVALENAGLHHKEIVAGIRIPGVASQFEAGCRAILGQQVSVAAAVNKLNQFFNHFKVQTDGAFPSPELVANDDLMFLKIPNARRQSLINLARFLMATPDADPSEWLSIKGIGPWTVNYVLMRAQGSTDIWLNTDLVVKQQVTKLADAKRELNDTLASPWRSYLSLNLWSMSD
ncbi:DNA-3-methyladenine glycosylase 2 family protein [Glaciecola petra]|uniref:DNA-3-methyladenine glycosylase II n=1 Tax=Glaciecola petra TaxID=3075602 RepID=A0ABU2ZRN4_9ALTE|nr:Ada metal-binding domain-containing protein [Aestuariibacter sp. P117]MDT0595285.1 Ada metal-binding domain-containing protein [Aestuariibacter sp. P117]